MQNWRKVGHVYAPDGTHEWSQSHAQMPIVAAKSPDTFRVYFSTRDAQGHSRPGWLALRIGPDFQPVILEVGTTPLLDLGDRGMYDDAGVMPTCLMQQGQRTYLFYNGWTLGKKVPFFSFNGIAFSDDGQHFTKCSPGPAAIWRDAVDPISTFAPFVLKANDHWKMWYVSCLRWEEVAGELLHYYHIRYATSTDGLNWKREGQVAIDFQDEYEYAIARPMVIFEDEIYKMWFSFRADRNHSTYRVGYAESSDGIDWQRTKGQVSLQPSIDGWDSEMVCYPYIFDVHGKRCMLYNGNGYGRTGFGLAVLEE